MPVQAKQPKADSEAAISQTFQAMEQAWLNAENAASNSDRLERSGKLARGSGTVNPHSGKLVDQMVGRRGLLAAG